MEGPQPFSLRLFFSNNFYVRYLFVILKIHYKISKFFFSILLNADFIHIPEFFQGTNLLEK